MVCASIRITLASYRCMSTSPLHSFRTKQQFDYKICQFYLPQPILKHFGVSYSFNTGIHYDKLADKTLEELCDFFEDLGDSGLCDKNYDVQYGNGVLTVHLGEKCGTYVINKQAPNKQIWLSSPFSGPKRYQVLNGKWIYASDGISLHETLSHEFSQTFLTTIDFTKLHYAHFGDINSWK